MNLAQAISELSVVGASSASVELVLAELQRLRTLEIDIARRVMPQTVDQIGAAETVELVRALVPRVIAPPPHRTGPT